LFLERKTSGTRESSQSVEDSMVITECEENVRSAQFEQRKASMIEKMIDSVREECVKVRVSLLNDL
jgi:hypothetical protein